MQLDSIEVWMPVPGYEGLYCVSSLGRVRTNASSPRISPDRILRSHPTGTGGYLTVWLQGNGAPKNRMIHILVAAAFIGPKPPEMSVNHIDGVKTNNRASNLEYLTREGQMRHAQDMGLTRRRSELQPPARRPYPAQSVRKGAAHHNAKLTDAQIEEIRRRRVAGETGVALAHEFGIHPRHLRAIVNGGRWDHRE
jgi:hypothetical protein